MLAALIGTMEPFVCISFVRCLLLDVHICTNDGAMLGIQCSIGSIFWGLLTLVHRSHISTVSLGQIANAIMGTQRVKLSKTIPAKMIFRMKMWKRTEKTQKIRSAHPCCRYVWALIGSWRVFYKVPSSFPHYTRRTGLKREIEALNSRIMNTSLIANIWQKTKTLIFPIQQAIGMWGPRDLMIQTAALSLSSVNRPILKLVLVKVASNELFAFVQGFLRRPMFRPCPANSLSPARAACPFIYVLLKKNIYLSIFSKLLMNYHNNIALRLHYLSLSCVLQ